MTWTVQEAKQKFGELVRTAQQEGPQVVTCHGQVVAVLVSAETYRKLASERDFKAFLRSAPALHDLEISRSDDEANVVDMSR